MYRRREQYDAIVNQSRPVRFRVELKKRLTERQYQELEQLWGSDTTEEQEKKLREKYGSFSTSEYAEYLTYSSIHKDIELDLCCVDRSYEFCREDTETLVENLKLLKIGIQDIVAHYFDEDQNIPYARTIYRNGELVYQLAYLDWEDKE